MTVPVHQEARPGADILAGSGRGHRGAALVLCGVGRPHPRGNLGDSALILLTSIPFNHDFSNLKQHSEDDRKVVERLGGVLTGWSKRCSFCVSPTNLAQQRVGLFPSRGVWCSYSMHLVRLPPCCAV